MNSIRDQHTGRVLSTGATRRLVTSGPTVSRLDGLLSVTGAEFTGVVRKAQRAVEQLPDPYGAPKAAIGLMLGRIQAGKTNAMITTAAVAIDNGYKLLIVLTSDNTWLYRQTLGRFKDALPGVNCIGMTEWDGKQPQIKEGLGHSAVLLVVTKNKTRLTELKHLIQSLVVRDVPALVFDDEADQASLNTNANKPGSVRSTINELISEVRNAFLVSGFLQVTATPQALLLLDPKSSFRPSFIVVLDPGASYDGGDTYFDRDSPYLRDVDPSELAALKRKGSSPDGIPDGLKAALCTFFVAAAAQQLLQMDPKPRPASCLIHVSLRQQHHQRVRDLVESFRSHMTSSLRGGGSAMDAERVRADLAAAYDELARTASLPSLEDILRYVAEMSNSTDVQLLDATSDQKEPNYSVRFNILIGGAKLGRGVTIQGLLVTYYGRESQAPQMDTVQQHARMYGYRKESLPFTRIFLPQALAQHFRDINLSENELREWLSSLPGETLQQIIARNMQPTRKGVLNPATVACYVPGQAYTPGTAVFSGYTDRMLTERMDSMLGVPPRGDLYKQEVTVDRILEVLSLVQIPPDGAGRWEDARIRAALAMLRNWCDNQGCLVVFAGRRLRPNEKPNVADSDDLKAAAADRPTLLMFRQDGRQEERWNGVPFWIPVVRFPDTGYPVYFNFS